MLGMCIVIIQLAVCQRERTGGGSIIYARFWSSRARGGRTYISIASTAYQREKIHMAELKSWWKRLSRRQRSCTETFEYLMNGNRNIGRFVSRAPSPGASLIIQIRILPPFVYTCIIIPTTVCRWFNSSSS